MATGKSTPFVPNNELFKKLEIYWNIEIWPNLKSILEAPIIILCSLINLEYGKWYNRASGVFTFEYINKIKLRQETKKIFLINSFIFCLKKPNLTTTRNKNKIKKLFINKLSE